MTTHQTSTSSSDSALTLMARVAGISPDTAGRLLASHGSLGALRHLDLPSLRAHGLPLRQATRLHDALDLAARLSAEPSTECPRVTNAREAARLVLPEMGQLEAEQMRILLLTRKNTLIAAVTLYIGTIDAIHVRVAEIFRAAIRHNASSLIVVHNHPSADPTPSAEDIAVTRAIVQAGRLLDLPVLDHLVVGGSTYTSLRERGLGWEP